MQAWAHLPQGPGKEQRCQDQVPPSVPLSGACPSPDDALSLPADCAAAVLTLPNVVPVAREAGDKQGSLYPLPSSSGPYGSGLSCLSG